MQWQLLPAGKRVEHSPNFPHSFCVHTFDLFLPFVTTLTEGKWKWGVSLDCTFGDSDLNIALGGVMCQVWRIPMGHLSSSGAAGRKGGGGAVECWPYNNHYSAEMAIRRGLSVLGLETPWLDFPCVALLLCLWIAVACYSPFEYFCRQFNRDPIGCRFQGISWWSAR